MLVVAVVVAAAAARQGLARRAQSKHKRMAVLSMCDFRIQLPSNKQCHFRNRPTVRNSVSCDGVLVLQMNFTKRNVSKTQHNYKRMHFHISDVLLEIVLFGKIVNQNISVWQCCQCVISESRCPLKSDHFWNLPAVQRWCVLRRSFCLNS